MAIQCLSMLHIALWHILMARSRLFAPKIRYFLLLWDPQYPASYQHRWVSYQKGQCIQASLSSHVQPDILSTGLYVFSILAITSALILSNQSTSLVSIATRSLPRTQWVTQRSSQLTQSSRVSLYISGMPPTGALPVTQLSKYSAYTGEVSWRVKNRTLRNEVSTSRTWHWLWVGFCSHTSKWSILGKFDNGSSTALRISFVYRWSISDSPHSDFDSKSPHLVEVITSITKVFVELHLPKDRRMRMLMQGPADEGTRYEHQRHFPRKGRLESLKGSDGRYERWQ